MRKTRGTYTVAVQGALKVILGNDRMKAMALTVVLQCKLRGGRLISATRERQQRQEECKVLQLKAEGTNYGLENTS